MDQKTIETRIKEVIAERARVAPDALDPRQWVSAYGIDSLALLILREDLERSLQVYISDKSWTGFRSINGLIDYIGGQVSATPPSALREPTPAAPAPRGPMLDSSGLLHDEIEIGMPMTGRNNLAEGPLLQYLGDLRWKHIAAFTGIPSRRIADENGDRLYPTFFYVETAFPEARPMASFGENDRLKVVSTMRTFGGSLLDGVSFLHPADSSPTPERPFENVAQAVEAGIPAVRMSNAFVKQFSGVEWLKRARPGNPEFENIPRDALAPDSYQLVKQVQQDGAFAHAGPNYIPMTKGRVRAEYRLAPDRDLNGAGLVYFANYPVFLDICERDALLTAELALTEDLLDRRTLVRRRSAYLNNASARDMLSIETEAWIDNPFRRTDPNPEIAPIRLFVNSTMRRLSDERVMMISTAEKLIFGTPLEQAPFYPILGEPGR